MTTVLCVRQGPHVAMAGDGQVSMNNTVMKHQARKVRRVYHDQVLAGFAGSAADAFTLFGLFEAKLEEYRGNITRAAVELAKDWRTDRVLRRLEALLTVANREIARDNPGMMFVTAFAGVLATTGAALMIGLSLVTSAEMSTLVSTTASWPGLVTTIV